MLCLIGRAEKGREGACFAVIDRVAVTSEGPQVAGYLLIQDFFSIHGSVHRESIFNNCPTRCVLFSLLHF